MSKFVSDSVHDLSSDVEEIKKGTMLIFSIEYESGYDIRFSFSFFSSTGFLARSKRLTESLFQKISSGVDSRMEQWESAMNKALGISANNAKQRSVVLNAYNVTRSKFEALGHVQRSMPMTSHK
jgi:hypothetical protein